MKKNYFLVIFLIILFSSIFLSWCNNYLDSGSSLEKYYCRWVWNLQWNSVVKTNKLFESDTAWWWWFTESEWGKHRNDINTMYNNCINYKSSIQNDIEKYGYLMNKLNIDENILAYCIWERKFLRSFNEPESNQYDWVVKFTPSITIKDDSSISSSITSCYDELNKNPTLLTKNLWQ